MFISTLWIGLAVGGWLIVFAACFIFLLLAKKKIEQAEELETLVRSQNAIIDDLEKQVESKGDVSNTKASTNNQHSKPAEDHSEALEKANAELDYLQNQQQETTHTLEGLKQENAILDRQLQAMTETLQASEAGVLNEMLVNFTEESRQMMLQVQQLEKEKQGLQQKLEDTESTEKGTTGTVVGLKRKLAQAEEEIALLKKGR